MSGPPQIGAGVSLSDILTAIKNAVIALNNQAQTNLQINGLQSKCGITSATLVKSGQGRLVRVSVVVAGSATGTVYDASAASATTNPLYVIPTTAGIVEVNMPVSNGIVVAPGTGQTVTIGYS